MRVAPTICNRLVETAKGILLKFIPDVYIVTDHQKSATAGKSPAFGLTLVAETINGTFLCAEACSRPRDLSSSSEPNVPEDIATHAAHLLLEEIYRVRQPLFFNAQSRIFNVFFILRVDASIRQIKV